MPTCWYAWLGSSKCDGLVNYIVHDRRGCVLVCAAHAKWRTTTSLGIGHSDECPNKDDKEWRHITRVGE